MNDYSDIISIKYPFKEKNKSITRAVQFSPFSALAGFDQKIKEKEKILSKKIELSEQQKNILDYKLEYIKNNLNLNVEIIYFVKDEDFDSGKYINIKNKIKKIDINKKQIMISNITIPIKDIFNIEILK